MRRSGEYFIAHGLCHSEFQRHAPSRPAAGCVCPQSRIPRPVAGQAGLRSGGCLEAAPERNRVLRRVGSIPTGFGGNVANTGSSLLHVDSSPTRIGVHELILRIEGSVTRIEAEELMPGIDGRVEEAAAIAD